MPRKARVVVAGEPHHVTQRGNNGEKVFFGDEDRAAYRDRLFGYAEEYGLRVWAYCLMTNHIHVVAAPVREESLSKVFGRLSADYARAVNFRRERCGHLWGERFYSCPMDRGHALAAMAYVERNPLVAGMVQEAEEWRWSSAEAHLRGEDPAGRLDLERWREEYTPERWKEVLAVGIMGEEQQRRFQEATRSGLPFGPEEYVAKLERALGIRLRPRGRGRPRKAGEEAARAVGSAADG